MRWGTMKLELPDDHPIAEAIRNATGTTWQNASRLILSLDALRRDGSVDRIFALEIDTWPLTRGARTTLECDLTDPTIRNEQIKAMLTWPTLDGNGRPL